MTKEEYIKKHLGGWGPEAAEHEYARVMAGNRYEECPLKAAGFRLVSLSDLPTVVIGADGKCICTKDQRCLNVDRHDGERCTLEDLQRLNSEAIRRRAWQSGGD